MSVTPSEGIIARIKQKNLADLIARGKRLDGRGLTDYREIKIEPGVIDKAEGSALVHIGNTMVMAGIKVEPGEPFPDTPNEGILTVNTELVPLASPTFEPGPPDENAIELARVVDRGLRESKAIDLPKLCLTPCKTVLVVFVDIYILNHDGNLVDASSIAALAALLNTKMPKYEVDDDEIRLKPGRIKLPIQNFPIAVTQGKINQNLLVDPNLTEEQVMDAKLTITIDKEGCVCAMQKSGLGAFSLDMVEAAFKTAREKAEGLRKLLEK